MVQRGEQKVERFRSSRVGEEIDGGSTRGDGLRSRHVSR
jgi:hypothetical protein